jgi:hypothetical protein
MLNHPTKHHS